MTCCGGSRRAQSAAGQRAAGVRPQATGGPQFRRYPHAYFQYLGRTGMTVVGSVTGQRYRFAAPGQIVTVDSQDRRSIATVPGLRQVAHP